MNRYYDYLVRIAITLFDLDITRVIDDMIEMVLSIFVRLWNLLITITSHFNVRQYVDADKLESDLDIKVEDYYRNLTIWRYWKKILRNLNSVSEYVPLIPVLLEIASLLISTSRLLRLWLLSSFLITFICIWGIIATRETVSDMICKVMGINVERFDLDIFLKVSGLLMIGIGLGYLVSSIYSLDMITGLLCLTAINRIYRNIRSYLTVTGLENGI